MIRLIEYKPMLFNSTIQIGVTGFARSGKSVFIGSLAQALRTHDASASHVHALNGFTPFDRGDLLSTCINETRHPEIPHFPFKQFRDRLTGQRSRWPQPTEGISHLIVDLRYQKQSYGWAFERTLQIDLIDYPGEWLIDLAMLSQDYESWSKDMLRRAGLPPREQWSQQYRKRLETLKDNSDPNETAEALAEEWRAYLQQAANHGLVYNQPGRQLRPDKLLHAPVLNLIPLPDSMKGGKLYGLQEKRFSEYRNRVIKPFYNNVFSNMDRQIVLMDLLKTLDNGQAALHELQEALKQILQTFRYSRGSIFDWLTGHRTTHLLFAATKADHVVRTDRRILQKLMNDMIQSLDENNQLQHNVKHCHCEVIAAIRATQDRMTTTDPTREVLHGKVSGQEESRTYDTGRLPRSILQNGNSPFQYIHFDPPDLNQSRHHCFPAINLGKTLDFLLKENFE